MSLIGQIENLREKSDTTKKSVAVVASIVLTFLVLAMYVSFVFVSNSIEDNVASVGSAKNNVNSPTLMVKDSF